MGVANRVTRPLMLVGVLAASQAWVGVARADAGNVDDKGASAPSDTAATTAEEQTGLAHSGDNATDNPADQARQQPAPAASPEAIKQLEAAGGRVMPLFADSPSLQVSFGPGGSAAGDAAAELLPPLAEQLVWLDLAGAKLSSAGWARLPELKNLTRLHVERSSLDDAALAQIGKLSQLEYLNLYDTATTDAGIASLAELKHLRQLYLWKTKASLAAAKALEVAVPGLRVDLGWDHPEILRKRLQKEVQVAKASGEEAAKRVKDLEQQLDAAKKDQERIAAQAKELDAKINELDGKGSPDAAVPADKPAETGEGKPAEPAK